MTQNAEYWALIKQMVDSNEDDALRRFPMLPRSERWPEAPNGSSGTA